MQYAGLYMESPGVIDSIFVPVDFGLCDTRENIAIFSDHAFNVSGSLQGGLFQRA
jgi:hypothetical protein